MRGAVASRFNGHINAYPISPQGPTLYPKDIVSEQPERFFVSELVREKIFTLYDQEIPYATQVLISEFKERQGAKDYIKVASTHVGCNLRSCLLSSNRLLPVNCKPNEVECPCGDFR